MNPEIHLKAVGYFNGRTFCHARAVSDLFQMARRIEITELDQPTDDVRAHFFYWIHCIVDGCLMFNLIL